MCTLSDNYSVSRNLIKMLDVQFNEKFQDIERVSPNSLTMKDFEQMEALVSNFDLSITITRPTTRPRTRRKDQDKRGSRDNSNGETATSITIMAPVVVPPPTAAASKDVKDAGGGSRNGSCCSKRKVQFKSVDLVEVIEFEDDDDSKQNRKIYWEIFAVDRSRFKDRIHRTEEALGDIFSAQHRHKIYTERILPQLHEQDGLLPRPFTPPCCTLSCPLAASSPSSTTSTLSSTFTIEAPPPELSKSQKKRKRRNRIKQKKKKQACFMPITPLMMSQN